MVSESLAVDGLNAEESATVNALYTVWRNKLRGNLTRNRFYDMPRDLSAQVMGESVPDVIRRNQFILGWSTIAVDKLARRCNLSGFYAEDGDDLVGLGLNQLVRDNRLICEVGLAGTSCLINSVSFLVTSRGDSSRGEPAALIRTVSASKGAALWDSRARRVGAFLEIERINDEGDPVSMRAYLPVFGSTPNAVNIALEKASGRWRVVDRDYHRFGIPVDALRYRPNVERPFGASRISRAVMSLHRQAVGTMVRAEVNAEAYSMMRFIILGVGENALRDPRGGRMSPWSAAWKAVWTLGDKPPEAEERDNLARADVKQFLGQSPEPQLQHLRMIAQQFSGETGIPVSELGFTTDSNPSSAEALLVSRDDLIIEATRTMRGWSDDLGAAVRRGLAILNDGDIPQGLSVRPSWDRPVDLSPSAAADAGVKILTAAPWIADTSVGLEVLGLAPEQAERALAERGNPQQQ